MPTPGFCDELQHVYLAQDLTFGEIHPDEDEFLEHVALPLEDAAAMAVDGRLEDSQDSRRRSAGLSPTEGGMTHAKKDPGHRR